MTLEELEIVVKADITDVTNKLNQLKTQLQDKVQATVDKVSAQTKPMVQSVGTAITNVSVSTTRELDIVNKQIELQTQKVKKLKEAYIEELKYAKAYQESGNKNWLAPDVTGMKAKYEQAQIQLDKMTLRADKMREKMSQAGEEIEETGEKITKTMKKSEKHANKFIQTLGRMIRLMIIRNTIRQAIQGFNDLTKASSEYNQVMSNIQSSMLQARNSITTAFAPALQMLEPYLVRFAEIVSDLFTKIAMYASAFAGNNFYYRATKVTTDYAKALGKASNEQQRLLAGFDELNVLQENKNSGGATGIPEAESMFEKVDIPQDVLDRVASIKQTLQDLAPLLATIGTIIAGYKLGELFNLWGTGKSKVDKLTDAFKNKNSALGDQQEEYAKEYGWLKQLLPAFTLAGVGVYAFSKLLSNIKLELPSLEPLTAFQNAFETARQFISEKIEGIKTALDGLQVKISGFLPTIVTSVATALSSIWTSVVTAKDNIATNVQTLGEIVKDNVFGFVEATKTAIYEWAVNIATNTYLSFVNMVENTKTAFETIQQNAYNFIISVSGGIKVLCENMSKNVVNTTINLVETFTSGFKKIWDDFVGLMQSLGESISKWWSQNKSWVIPTAMVGLSIAGVALAGFTGGASLALAPLATGGVLKKPTPILAGEYAGASQNPEIVTPQKLMLETNMQANVPVMNAIEEMGDKLVTALNSIGVYAEFDYSKLKVGLDNENYRVGGKLYGI